MGIRKGRLSRVSSIQVLVVFVSRDDININRLVKLPFLLSQSGLERFQLWLITSITRVQIPPLQSFPIGKLIY